MNITSWFRRAAGNTARYAPTASAPPWAPSTRTLTVASEVARRGRSSEGGSRSGTPRRQGRVRGALPRPAAIAAGRRAGSCARRRPIRQATRRRTRSHAVTDPSATTRQPITVSFTSGLTTYLRTKIAHRPREDGEGAFEHPVERLQWRGSSSASTVRAAGLSRPSAMALPASERHNERDEPDDQHRRDVQHVRPRIRSGCPRSSYTARKCVSDRS